MIMKAKVPIMEMGFLGEKLKFVSIEMIKK
jgi:hypothetical protein